MKRSTFVAAIILLCLAVSAHAAAPASSDPSLDRDVRHLLELSGTSKLAQQMIAAMIPNFRQMAPDAPAGFWDEFAREVNPQELVEMVVPIYKQHLSHDDIRGAIAFYESPAGQHLVANQPAILQDSMAVGQKWGQQLAQRAMAKVKQQKKKP
ncbi:MAG: uncharacterized protein QOJ16_2054 [Acidobacteriota bacterium]|jgi:hypothetical protein|nr:uncharacterized protein [Acidobacteriota bacterium]